MSETMKEIERLVDAVRATSLRFAAEHSISSAKEGDAAELALLDAVAAALSRERSAREEAERERIRSVGALSDRLAAALDEQAKTIASLAAAERERDEARAEIEAVIDALDEFAPHNTGLPLGESTATLRTRLSEVRAEIEARGGWRDREAAARAEADGLREALRNLVAWVAHYDDLGRERYRDEYLAAARAALGEKGSTNG